MASTPDSLYVTFVDVDRELLKIWGQRNRIGATYIERQLLQLLPELSRALPPIPSQIHKGMFCFARNTDDNFYRARVLSGVQNDFVGVMFVDYGSRDSIKLSNIRLKEGMEAEVLAKMSEQAEEYYLAGVIAPSTGWTKEIVSEIRRDICYEEFLYHIVAQAGDRKILELKFRNEDFSKYLIRKRLANPLSIPVQRQMVLTYCRLVPGEIAHEGMSRELPRLNYPPSLPTSNMRGPFRQSPGTNEGMMMNFGKTNSPVNFPEAPRPIHHSSPRATNSSPQQMNQNIPKITYFPPVNLPPTQMNFNPIISQPINPPMNPLMNTQFNPMLVKESVDSLNCNNNIIKLLAQQVKQYIAEDNAKTESETEKIPHHYVNSVLEVGNTYNVIISFIDDGPWSFSVQLMSSETELQKLMDELSTTELVPLKPPIILGHPCIASSAVYGNLCRGVVVSISRSAVKVYFVDFGNTEDLPSSSIYELPPKFFKIRVLSQKFSLSGLQKVIYSDDIKKFFKEVVHDEFLMLRVMSLEDDNLPTCELYLKDKNIKRILNEKIRELRSSSMDDFPKVGETEHVVVTWVVSPQKFFVQLHKRDPDLNALKKELADVETKGHRLTYQQLGVGFKCVCLYESDGKWYRAVITSVDSENEIKVFYVDYGNTETVNISKLRRVQMSGLISQMGNQAIQCSLKGFENGSNDQSLTSKLESLILEKDLQMSVVSSEKELLCVQLFDHGKDISEILLTATPPKSETFETSSQAFSSPFSIESSYTKNSDRFEAKDPYGKKENKNPQSDQLRRKSGRPIQTSNSQGLSKPTKSRKRFEESWRSGKDMYWNEPKADDHSTENARGFKQNTEMTTWDNNNNNSGGNTVSKPFEKGPGERGDGRRFERSREFKRDKSRDARGERREGGFGDRRKPEERGGREKFDEWKSDEGKRFERKGGDGSWGREDGGKKFERRRRDGSWGKEDGGKRFERKGWDASWGREKKLEERKSSRKPIRSEDVVPPGSKFEDKNVVLGTSERCIVTYYFSPHDFFIQLLADEEEFKKMMKDIQAYYSDKYSHKDPFEAGDIVIAQFSLDKVLYRGEVIKPSPLTVRYVDYGNQEPVGPKSTWLLDKQFLKLPKQVVKCRLANIEPNGSYWPPPGGAIDKFFEHSEFKCTFLSLEGDTYEISLEDMNTGNDIARELINAGLARAPIPKLDVPEIDTSLLPSQILRLYISHVQSSLEFYVVLNPKGLEVIENAVKTFVAEKKGLVPLNEASIQPGVVCLTTVDDILWHRADVIKTDGNTVGVWLRDKGDKVDVTADKVMSLPDYLKVFRPQAVECSLFDSPITGSENEFKKAVEFKHHLVSVISVTEECLSVVLYNENGVKLNFQQSEDFPQTIEPIAHLPIISQKIQIVVSHVDSPCEVYIQRLIDADGVSSLTEKICDFYSEERENVNEGEELEGMLVAAKSSDYDSWYRGRVVSSSETNFEIFYIDYGNKEMVLRENVKKLDRSFLEEHAFSNKLSLDVEFKVEAAAEINKKIYELIDSNDIFGYFVNDAGRLLMELMVNGERLTPQLESEDLTVRGNEKFDEILSGKRVEKEPEVVEVEVEVIEVEVEVVSDRPCAERVFVSHIDSPNLFWVHRETVTNELHLFQDKLQKSCEVLSDKENPQVGDVVAALFSKMWYRGKVTDVDEKNLTVQFVDYGNSVIVDLNTSSVKQLTEEFLRVPIFAQPFALMGTWDSESTSKFEEIILQNDESVRVVVVENSEPAVVDLYQNERSISEMLRCRLDEETQKKKENLETVYISHSNSPKDFYVHLATFKEVFTGLNKRLEDAHNFENSTVLEPGKIYASKFPEDEAWYRAKVQATQGDSVEVYYVDYGNTSTVTSTDVKILPDDLVDIPYLAQNYSLLYGNNDSWSAAACEKLAELADGRELEMKIEVNRPRKPIVKLFDGDDCINSELEKLCEPEEREEAYVSYAVSPTDFYIQYVKDERYKAVVDALENEHADVLEEMNPGTMCQARYVEDGVWYRAKIQRKADEGCEVFFVDYGNVSVSTELKKLPGTIAEIPPLALKCSLDLPETNIPESVKEEFVYLTGGGATIFRVRIITPGEVNLISLKLNGRIIEESLGLEENVVNHDDSSRYADAETDDGKNNRISQGYLKSNETDEEKRVKIAMNGIEGFKSDDEKHISPGFVNVTDNELMEEVRENEDERGNDSGVSTFDFREEAPVHVNGNGEHDTDTSMSNSGASDTEKLVNGEKTGKRITRNKVNEIVPGSISRGTEEENVAVTSPTQYQKVKFSDKLVPGSISRGISLESMPSENEPLEDSPEKRMSKSAPNTPKLQRKGSSGYTKVHPSDRMVPGCISMGISPSCSPGGEKIPANEKIVAGAVNGSLKDH